MKWHLFLSSVICLCCGIQSGATQSFTFSHIGLESGLSQSSILSMVQDDFGFWWFGTQDGLNRYDGYEFRTYKNQPFDSMSLAKNRVDALMAEEKGLLWVGTYGGGLQIFDPGRQIFKRVGGAKNSSNSLTDDHVTDLLTDRRGYKWVATQNGVNRLSVKGDNPFEDEIQIKKILLASGPENENWSGMVSCLYEDKSGTIWVGGVDKLYSLKFVGNDSYDVSTMSLPAPGSGGVTYKRIVNAIQTDHSGTMWVGSSGGLFFLNDSSVNLMRFEQFPLSKARISNITVDVSGNLLLVTEGDGLYFRTYDPRSQIYADSFNHVEAKPDGKGLSSNFLGVVVEDKINPGSYWVGTMVNGIDCIYPNFRKFRSNPLNDLGVQGLPESFIGGIFKDEQGNIWMAPEMGLLLYRQKTNSYEYIRPAEAQDYGLSHPKVYSFADGVEGDIWIGTRRGLSNTTLIGNRPLSFKSFYLPDSCPEMVFYTLSHDRNGKLLLGSISGVNVLDPGNPHFKGCNICLDTLGAKGGHYLVTSIHHDRSNRLWVGSTKGLVMLPDWKGEYKDLDISRIKRFNYDPGDMSSLPTTYINSITEDDEGQLWLGSSNGLIHVVEEGKEFRFEIISEKDGLANEMIYSVLFDRATESLWMSTNRGISRYHIPGKKVDNYGPKDGLQGHEFNQGAYSQASDGEILVGGLNGYTRYFPREIAINPNPPLIWISAIQIAGGDRQELTYLKEKYIDLDYHNNSFTLHYIGLGDQYPSDHQYAYRLATREDLSGVDWIPMGSQRQLSLSKISPGTYIFQVRGANRDGIWNETGDKIHIHIRPPFWQTRLFYFIILLGIGIILWGLHAYRVQVKVKRLRELERVRKNAAADFHDELGHKLTIISLFGEILKKQLNGSGEQVKPHVNKIISTANSLYYAMKDLLWVLDPEKDTILDLFILLKDFGDELFDKTGIAFRTEGTSAAMADHKLSMDQKRHIMLIFKEVMNNALKHAEAENVVLSAHFRHNMLQFVLTDDGKGFDIEETGNGHGLSNVRDRAKKIGANLSVQSHGFGTQVQLDCTLLPVNS